MTNHAAVLLSIARDPEIRLRDVAERVGITERAAQRIVRDLVEAMGGTLQVASEVDAGSRFTVRLPVHAPQRGRRMAEGERKEEAVFRSPPSAAAGKSLRVLVVDWC